MNNIFIAKEGIRLTVLLLLVAVIMFIVSNSWVLQLISVVLLLGTVYLFRNPKIVIERFEKYEILSVCDGVVANIETIDCQGKIKGECYKVTVLNRLIDKGELRAPFDSTIAFMEYRRGMQLALYSKKSNEWIIY